MNSSTLSGVIAPVSTPFTAAGEPDAGRFVQHARWLLSDGCTALAPFGTTSEANSLSMAERKVLLISLLAAGIDPGKIMPGTGLCSVPETVDMTRHAIELSCAGVLMLPPFFYKNVSDEGLYRHFAQVFERVGDNRLRVYLYHIPQTTQVGLSVELIQRLARAFPEVVAGVKDSTGDWSHTKKLIESLPGLAVFSGSEAALANAVRIGGAGCISGAANFNARMLRRVFDAPHGAEADAIQSNISAIRSAVEKLPLIAAVKGVLAEARKDPVWLNMRPPLRALTPAEASALTETLAAFNLKLHLPAAAG